MTHEVAVLCNCDDIEQCAMEVYVSDVRIAVAEIARKDALMQAVERVWGTGLEVMRPVFDSVDDLIAYLETPESPAVTVEAS